jgi:predicted Zn-dependent protease with MMP-like domain
MEATGFEEHVRAALDALPPELAGGLENVAVVVADEHPGDPNLFGTFHGVPRTEQSAFGPSSPATITIYRRPLEDEFPDPDELEHEIRVTVLHELAHYFGIDEERLGELGYE